MIYQFEFSIVIVSWNVKDLLLQTISDFVNRKNIEIIIVDNNSNDGTVECIRIKYPEIVIVQNLDNPGFAKGNNQGFKIARGEYTFILNPDTICSYSCLEGLRDYMKMHPECGAIGPKIFYENGIVQKSCARRLPTLKSFFFMDVLRLKKINIPFLKNYFNKLTKYPYDYSAIQKVEALSGAAMLVRTAILVQLEGFKDIYLHTGEDIDLCKRINDLNLVIIYHSGFSLIHLAGQSSKQDLLKVMIKTHKSSFQFFKEIYGSFTASIFWTILIGLKIPSDLLYYYFKYRVSGKHKFEYELNLALLKTLTK